MTILNQFSDDIRQMMTQSTDSIGASRAATRRAQTVANFDSSKNREEVDTETSSGGATSNIIAPATTIEKAA